MKKYLAITMLAAAVFFLAGCGGGKGQDNIDDQAGEKTSTKKEKTQKADSGITVPASASKECKKEYTEKTDGKYADCYSMPEGKVCVYYKKKSAGTNHRIEQTNECQACMNWGRPEILDKNLEFMGMVKGECPRGNN